MGESSIEFIDFISRLILVMSYSHLQCCQSFILFLIIQNTFTIEVSAPHWSKYQIISFAPVLAALIKNVFPFQSYELIQIFQS
ncbi:hypothetical protein FGO68_gene1421 [Halteria grandinella]|uniref:Uncharacterized protein n=1 Tax=Halteria grandinella TaxID=5974 RepID=A0A8J8SYF1_HALGN|nr:hypothetical protein FGO68_gene1421 [Halteria grandinella]